ncbi:glycosyltransferase family 9 protein [Rosettibacter firmus]|uniref:glycosyltransferase family 9 protein n=1 Tax=Rosettibacter firmus TaxID=3111522 RepID=UPI00336BEC34
MEILNSKKRILIIQTAFLGDAILTLPMIQKLKEYYPQYYIDVLCIPSTSEIYKNSPFVDDVIIYDKKKNQKSLIDLFYLIKTIRKKEYSKVYSPHRSFRSAIISKFSNASETFGFDNASFNFLYKYKMHYEKNKHEVERNLKLIGYDTSKNNWRILPSIKYSEESEHKINELLKFITKKIVAIAPGSVWKTKIYPKEYYEVIVKYLTGLNYFVCLIGSSDDKLICEYLNEKFPDDTYSLAGKLTVIDTITLLKKCTLLICNDSAPTHMAMAANIPTLTIYCSTIPDFGFYPYNSKSDFISYNDLKCKPCGIHGYNQCPLKTFDCGYLLTPQMVINRINQLINIEKKNS